LELLRWELPVVDAHTADACHFAHAAGAGAELGQAEQLA
jgi:hypothetical protein